MMGTYVATYDGRTFSGTLLSIADQMFLEGYSADAVTTATNTAVMDRANPCPVHPAFEADYCTPCGTAAVVR